MKTTFEMLKNGYKEVVEKYYEAIYDDTGMEHSYYVEMNNLAESMWELYPEEAEKFFFPHLRG